MTISFLLIRAKGANKEVKETETKTNGTIDPEPELDVEPVKKVEDYDDDSMVSYFFFFVKSHFHDVLLIEFECVTQPACF